MTFSAPTADTLFYWCFPYWLWNPLIQSVSCTGIFLSGITEKSLNAFIMSVPYARSGLFQVYECDRLYGSQTDSEHLQSQPVFLCIDDTMVSKFGKKFEDVSKLFDHAAHNGSNYLNGHCFVSIMLAFRSGKMDGSSIFLSSRIPYMQKKNQTGTCSFHGTPGNVPVFASQKNVIILCDSWYAKKKSGMRCRRISNLDLICNARSDSVIYDLAPQRTGKRGRPAKT